MNFYVGLDDLHHAEHFDRVFISVNRLWNRRKQGRFRPKQWIKDSGAFTEIAKYGRYIDEPEVYAAEIDRWAGVGELECAVTQDYMCEPAMLEKTGLTIPDHQRLTIERFDRIAAATKVPIMPVLQGYAISDYIRHVGMYGDRLKPGMRVGVGSVCKRNSNPAQIEDILSAIHSAAPNVLLHGFGVKTTALASERVCELLFSADSMAWSFAARYEGRDAHDWREAKAFERRIQTQPRQRALIFP